MRSLDSLGSDKRARRRGSASSRGLGRATTGRRRSRTRGFRWGGGERRGARGEARGAQARAARDFSPNWIANAVRAKACLSRSSGASAVTRLKVAPLGRFTMSASRGSTSGGEIRSSRLARERARDAAGGTRRDARGFVKRISEGRRRSRCALGGSSAERPRRARATLPPPRARALEIPHTVREVAASTTRNPRSLRARRSMNTSIWR